LVLNPSSEFVFVHCIHCCCKFGHEWA
jgi:hypothetical protein